MFFTYIIQSQCDDSFYIGHSSDIKQRLEYHNGGLSKYTSKKMPWKLVYLEVYQTKADANRRELFLKKQRSRSFYKQLILSDTNLMENLMRKYRPVTPRVAGFPSTRDPHRLKKLQEIEAFFVCSALDPSRHTSQDLWIKSKRWGVI